MAKVAIGDAEAGFNVYCETRTVRRGLPRWSRGAVADTIGVFAFCIDGDADKGKAAKIPIDGSLVVESSPGNEHTWLFVDRAILDESAVEIGRGIRATVGGDADTGVITQPFRVAGTPNYPGAAKRARGRVVTATTILKSGGPVWSKDLLLAAFPPPPVQQRTSVPSGRSGVVDPDVEAIVGSVAPTDRGKYTPPARRHAPRA